MCLNNKGFAITTILYGLLLMATLILFLLIGNLSFERRTTDEFVENIKNELNGFTNINDTSNIITVKEDGTYSGVLKDINNHNVAVGDKIKLITPINENYLINDAFVLRLPRKDHDELINYKLEKEVYEKIEPLKISEKVIFLDAKKGTKVTKFVHNTRFYFNTPNEEQIRYVSKTLKKLHTSKIKVSKDYEALKKIDYYKKSGILRGVDGTQDIDVVFGDIVKVLGE